MVWDVLNVIGTIAFAMSGAVVALEVKYDIMGAYVLGLITAFGGGAIRNLFRHSDHRIMAANVSFYRCPYYHQYCHHIAKQRSSAFDEMEYF
jgi:hypothetical protein